MHNGEGAGVAENTPAETGTEDLMVPDTFVSAGTNSEKTGRIKSRKLTIGLVVAALLGGFLIVMAALYVLQPRLLLGSCSKYDAESWEEDFEKSRTMCKLARCRFVETQRVERSWFEMHASSYSKYGCLDPKAYPEGGQLDEKIEEGKEKSKIRGKVLNSSEWFSCANPHPYGTANTNLCHSILEKVRVEQYTWSDCLSEYEVGLERDICLDKVARTPSDYGGAPWEIWHPEYCEAISDTEIEWSCWYYVALALGDPQYCARMSDSFQYWNNCWHRVGAAIGDVTACEHITYEPSRDLCTRMCNPTIGCGEEGKECVWSTDANHHVCVTDGPCTGTGGVMDGTTCTCPEGFNAEDRRDAVYCVDEHGLVGGALGEASRSRTDRSYSCGSTGGQYDQDTDVCTCDLGDTLDEGSGLCLLPDGRPHIVERSVLNCDESDWEFYLEQGTENCLPNYLPVCATMADGTDKTYINECLACQDPDVAGYRKFGGCLQSDE